MNSEIKFVTRQVKSYLTIGKPSTKGFIYTRELMEDVLKQQQPLIDDKILFVTLGYSGKQLTDKDMDKIEGIVTKAEITEDNKVTYTITFFNKIANMYLSMNIPMSIEILIKANIVDNKYLTEIEIANYVDVVFDNPKEAYNTIMNAVDYIKELSTTIEVK